MALKRFVSAATVNDLLQKGLVNHGGIRILDCSYAIPQKLDHKLFKEELYGKFELLHKNPTPSIKLHLSGHIPEAVHMNLDAAVYPSKYERFAMYPPELFEQYIQLLGVHKDEHLILYSKGPLHGMLFPARCAWLFKSYGHDKVSLMDGGWNQWLRGGYEISFDKVVVPKGDWKADDKLDKYTIQYDELRQVHKDDKELIDSHDKINFLDSRPRKQFEGKEDTGLDPYMVNGCRIPGFKNCPSHELLTEDGLIKPEEEIKQWLSANGYEEGKPVITNCNTGMTASLLSYAIDGIIQETPRLYGGSLKELELRAPEKISEGPSHLS